MMPDINRPGSMDIQVTSAQRGVEKSKERLVQVRAQLLRDLGDLQKHLETYITGYISSQELLDWCEKIEARLELGNREKHRLWDPIYWVDIRSWLNNAYKKFFDLKPMIEEKFKEMYEKNHMTLMDAFSGPAHNPQGADVVSIAMTGLTTIGKMKVDVDPIIEQIKDDVDTKLEEIRGVINRIEAQIELTSEQLSGEASQQRAGYGYHEGAVEHKKEPSYGETRAAYVGAKDTVDERGR